VSSAPQNFLIRVSSLLDVRQAEATTRSFAGILGFSPDDCDQLAIVVSELGSNLVKHAHGGSIQLRDIAGAGCSGIEIDSEDEGPGFRDFEQALTDGYSTAGSLGTSLGAINRLMDDLEFSSLPEGGARIVCKRWLRPAATISFGCWLEFGAATRSYRMQRENGDAFIVRQWQGKAIVGVIDGLGHGQFAQRASQTAKQYIETHFDQSLDNLFRGVGRACRATRGVVMALAAFDGAQRTFKLGSVGNIETRVYGQTGPLNFVLRRGVIGLNAPQPVVSDHAWTPQSIMIMHSDGLRTHWDWQEFRELANEPAEVIARALLNALGKLDDDATIVVVRTARS